MSKSDNFVSDETFTWHECNEQAELAFLRALKSYMEKNDIPVLTPRDVENKINQLDK